MFGRKYKRQMRGRAILASTLNRPMVEIERQSRISASAPLAIRDTPNGPQIYDTTQQPFCVSLTSGSGAGPYAWTRQVSTGPGTWTNGVQVGTTSVDPAYNSSGAISLTLPKKVWVRRSAGTLYFNSGTC